MFTVGLESQAVSSVTRCAAVLLTGEGMSQEPVKAGQACNPGYSGKWTKGLQVPGQPEKLTNPVPKGGNNRAQK